MKQRLKNINVEIKNHFKINKRACVRHGIVPGNSKSFWKAVNIAKDINNVDLPVSMFTDGIQLANEDLKNHFADYFENKILTLSSTVVINEAVYNGIGKIMN